MSRRNARRARIHAFVFSKLVAIAAALVLAATANPVAAQQAVSARAPNVFGSTALMVSRTAFDGRWAGVASDRPALTGAALGLVSLARPA